MSARMDILQACESRHLFAPWFRDPATWEAWRAFLAALFGLPMDAGQLALYRQHTGREEAPTDAFTEAWLCCGRRAGKSFIMALAAVYLATFRDYRPWLQPGERATIAVIAADRKQARSILRYARAMLTEIAALRKRVERETAEGFDLQGQVTIEIGTASSRTTRGYAFAAALVDEVAHIPSDEKSASPDAEIIAAIKPGLLQIPGALLLCASSPHARRGVLWEAYDQFWGQDGAPLVWKATSREMNPTLRQSEIDEALRKDPARYGAEYLAEFRTDVETLLTLEAIRTCIDEGVRERRPMPGVAYRAFADPSGGSADSMCLAIGHREGDRAVIDLVREVQPPFSPEAATKEFADVLKDWGLRTVVGDRFGGLLQRERFAAHGIEYRLADHTASELYLGFVGIVNSASVVLPDNDRLTAQLVGLERRLSIGGRELVRHKPGAHDDLANVVAGVAERCLRRVETSMSVGFATGDGAGPIVDAKPRQRIVVRHMTEAEQIAEREASGRSRPVGAW